jgi:hypothetical protein
MSNVEGKKEKRMKKERKRMNIERWCAQGVYLPEGRLPSLFGVPCSSFDIPAEGGSFPRRSPGKSVGANCQGRGKTGGSPARRNPFVENNEF